MQKTILIYSIIGLSLTNYSQAATVKDPTPLDFCELFSKYAKTTMHNRQNGGEAQTSIRNILSNTKNKAMQDYFIAIVKDAYAEPLWVTESNKIKAETEFGNKVFMDCLNEIRK